VQSRYSAAKQQGLFLVIAHLAAGRESKQNRLARPFRGGQFKENLAVITGYRPGDLYPLFANMVQHRHFKKNITIRTPVGPVNSQHVFLAAKPGLVNIIQALVKEPAILDFAKLPVFFAN
jgi:hypothetical protein